MKLVDLNILLYAVNQQSPRHELIRSWWEAVLAGDEPVGLPWIVILGFLRVSTNPRVFTNPLSSSQAIEQMEEWLNHPNVCIVRETDEHWRILRELLDECATAGNLTTDAHVAALAITHGAVLASCDADFGRFRHLRWVSPLG
ncbi:MAG: type II toxin-antitoxin system VapC family toxin [Planctomycetaceae bacterium]|nr:type II toxin-antitoxin system VapC family toxin [Planctomycetaceae bacterium]